jgi:hypothetical protein
LRQSRQDDADDDRTDHDSSGTAYVVFDHHDDYPE